MLLAESLIVLGDRAIAALSHNCAFSARLRFFRFLPTEEVYLSIWSSVRTTPKDLATSVSPRRALVNAYAVPFAFLVQFVKLTKSVPNRTACWISSRALSETTPRPENKPPTLERAACVPPRDNP